MDGERSDGGAGEAEVVDEFACAGMLRGSLTSLHGAVERIFGATFDIGEDNLSQGSSRQIWLQLQGQSDGVKAAKLFVKGVVNQEEQQEVTYPAALHCVFCGARGLFMDCLMRSTSAHVVVGSTGSVLISGLAEPVVRAYSLITDLVERYEGAQSRRSEAGDRGSGESLESRRAFKDLVEKWEDRHILDLLVLPGSVKEILLGLVKESGLGSNPSPALAHGNPKERSHEDSEGGRDGAAYRLVEGMTAGSRKESATNDSYFRSFFTTGCSRGRAEGAEERLTRSPQEVGEEDQPERVATSGAKVAGGEGEEEEQQLQFLLLLKFFTAMGYTEDVVKRVLARTGPKEASQILDLVQQEQDRSELEQQNQEGLALNDSERRRLSETERRGGDDSMNNTGGVGDVGDGEGGGATGGTSEEQEDGHEEDFVLGVLKKAAASCGYMEQRVAKVYRMLPDGSTHQLLLELQREEGKGEGAFREGPREVDDVVLEKGGRRAGPVEDEARGETEERDSGYRGWAALPTLNVPVADPDFLTWVNAPQQFTANQYTSHPKLHKSQTPPQNVPPGVKGPPTSTYSSSLDPPHNNCQSSKQRGQTSHWPHPTASKQTHVTQESVVTPKPQPSSSSESAPRDPPPSVFPGNDSSSTRAGERRGGGATAAAASSSSSSAAVTGEQRFLESLQVPFELKITDEPGDPTLRSIVIDGSNVAMSHGLSQFFSCRGIALAVQHFWDRGHRNICALLPQWRQRSDPKAKEQHYLGELQKLGMVSYTPSREVQGKRIASYDDRLMLQLAQKTGGVIVTNDNLRDLSDVSPAWRDIIKKRLLQYTFVGDLFMVPDDPLGRGGPHLDHFLRLEHSPHSFVGAATTLPSFKPPRFHTEGLHFHDRTPGGARGGGGSRARGRRKDWSVEHQHRQFGGDRSPEETASLREQLCHVFAGQDSMVALVLQSHPAETDVHVLSDLILEQQRD